MPPSPRRTVHRGSRLRIRLRSGSGAFRERGLLESTTFRERGVPARGRFVAGEASSPWHTAAVTCRTSKGAKSPRAFTFREWARGLEARAPRKSTSPGSRGTEPALRAQPDRGLPPEGGAQFESPSPRAPAGMNWPRFVVRRARRPGAVAAPVGSYQRRAPPSMRRCSGGALAEGSRRVASRPRVKFGAIFHLAPARHARSPSRASPSPA